MILSKLNCLNAKRSILNLICTFFITYLCSAQFALRINAGGDAITSGGKAFQADNSFKGKSKSFSNDDVSSIEGTEEDNLYLSVRSSKKGKDFKYEIKVPNGSYTVKLHFVELWYIKGQENEEIAGALAGPDKRVFTVNMQGINIISDFDLYKEAGAAQTAIIKSFENVNVTSGELTLDFSAHTDDAVIAAIEILSLQGEEEQPQTPPSLVRINAGGSDIVFDDITFDADTKYFSSNSKTFSRTNISDIESTDRDGLDLSERSSTGDFDYAIPITNGKYIVQLHFAEIWFGATRDKDKKGTKGGKDGPNQRIFSVKMEGEEIISDYDINAEVGTKTAVIRKFPVKINDGVLNLNFSASVNEAKISAIEILPDDKGDKEWRGLANCPHPHVEGQKAEVNGKLYLMTGFDENINICLLYTSPSPRDA